jgi:Co/Zn/Cd efflux system component
MTAGGDPQKIENAKTMLWYAFIGLIIILASRAILEAIKSVMGVK